jgi:hypothetical protein
LDRQGATEETLGGVGGRQASAAAWLAWALCLLCLALALSSLLLAVMNGRTLAGLLIDNIITVAILAASFSVVGALVASHRPENPIGWILCAAALFQGTSNFGYEYATYALLTQPGYLPLGTWFSWLCNWIWAPGLGLILVYLPLLFPSGRPPSRRWGWVSRIGGLSIGLITLTSAVLLWPERGPALMRPGDATETGTPWLLLEMVASVAFPLMLLAGLAAVVSLFVRFHRARGDERQQIKWFASSAALTLFWIFVIEVPPDGNRTFEIGTAVLSVFLVSSIPVATGIAILRHRLYDIDRFINRALVYAALTGTLVSVYVGGVVLLQTLFRALTGGESTLAVVASTLAIAALFSPLRRLIQSFIDRRFYRRKYDAARTLEAFGRRLRDETELGVLKDDLVGVIRETVQPAHVSLWIRTPSKMGEETGR